MTNKLIVLDDGTELSSEEAIVVLLQRVKENNNYIQRLENELHDLTNYLKRNSNV